jgi:hypothetical protein
MWNNSYLIECNASFNPILKRNGLLTPKTMGGMICVIVAKETNAVYVELPWKNAIITPVRIPMIPPWIRMTTPNINSAKRAIMKGQIS